MKKKHRNRKSAAQRVEQTAQRLARAHTRDLGTTDPQDRRPVEASVRLLAEHLPCEGGRINWEAIDVPGFFALLDEWSRYDQERLALNLMGFYYWLCVQHLASVRDVAEILDELAAQFPESVTLSLLHRCSMIGLAGGMDAVLASGQSAGDRTALN